MVERKYLHTFFFNFDLMKLPKTKQNKTTKKKNSSNLFYLADKKS